MITQPTPPDATRKKILYFIPNFIAIIGVVTSAAALFVYAFIGSFSRYYADDFCLSGMVFQEGFWKAQVTLYLTWSNRFAGMFLIGLSEFLGHSAIGIWTGLTIILWVCALTWAISQFCRLVELEISNLAVLFLAEFITLFSIIETPQLYQALFWRIGMVTYTLPLAFLMLLTGLIINQARVTSPGQKPWIASATCFIIAFFAAGFSETYVALQTSIILLVILFIFFFQKKQFKNNWFILLACSLAGSLLGMLVVILAPGNASRQALMPNHPGFITFIKMVIENAFLFMYIFLGKNTLQVLLSILAPLLLIYGQLSVYKRSIRWSPAKIILLFLTTPMIAFILIAAIMAPAAYAQSSYPDGRVLIEATFIMTGLSTVEGALLGITFHQLHNTTNEPIPLYLQLITAAILFSVIMYPLYDARKQAIQIPVYQKLANSWDARDAQIRAERLAGKSSVQVKGLNAPGGLSEFTSQSNNWVNACAARFYDLMTITVGNQ